MNALRFCGRLLTFAAMFAAIVQAHGVVQAETRIGVIAAGDHAGKIGTLLELRLSKRANVVLVERDAIEAVLREQKLQAVLAAGAPEKRAALGKLLKADLLVLLAGNERPKPHVLAVVCETQRGVRLVAEPVLPAANIEADVDAAMKHVETAAKKRKENIVEIVAVPPLVNNSLTHEADRFQGAFAKLVEYDLLRRPKVLVVELDEAKALAQEMVVGGAAGIERRLPLYLMGEYRFDGAGENQRGQFAWKLLRGEKELDRRQEKDLAVNKVPERLQQTAIELVDKALGKSDVRPEVEAEAKQLAGRARAFMAVGSWREALALAEASLLLKPDQPAVHGDALLALNRMAAELETFHGGAVTGETRQALAYMRAALPHLEAYFRGTEVRLLDHNWCLGDDPWHGLICRMWDPVAIEQLQACAEVYAELMQVAGRILAAKSAAKIQDDSLRCLAHYTEPPGPSEFGPARGPWLKKNLRTICEHRLKLLEHFVWLKVRQPGFPHVIGIRGVDPHDPVYLDFLAKAEKLPNDEIRAIVQDIRRSMERQAKRTESGPDRQPASKTNRPEVMAEAEVVCRRIVLTRSEPGGGERPFAQAIGAWLPIAKGADLVVTQSDAYAKVAQPTGDPARDLGLIEGELFLMREKGQLQRIDLGRDPRIEYTREETTTKACYDGRFIWVAVSTPADPLLAVIDPDNMRVRRFTADDGVPPFRGTRGIGIAAVAPGKVCVVGSFGRSWCAIASFDPGAGKSFKLFHEAREARDPKDHQQWERDGTAFDVKDVYCLPPKAGANGATPARVLVIREVAGGVLVIDPEKPAVIAVTERIAVSEPLIHEAAMYFKDRFRQSGRSTLCRMEYPKFKREEVYPDVPSGPSLVHAGLVHVWNGMSGNWYVAPALAGPYRQVRGQSPGSQFRPTFARSHHYGLLLFDLIPWEQKKTGVFQVELHMDSGQTDRVESGFPKIEK